MFLPETCPRELSARERGLLEKLLEPDFEGRDELRVQLQLATAMQVLEDGTLRLSCNRTAPAPGKYRVPMEATGTGSDGLPINVLLHLDSEGFMTILEIIYYGEQPHRPLSAEDLTLVPPIPWKRV